MTDPEIRSDRIEKIKEDARDSGFARKEEANVAARQKRELEIERKIETVPDSEKRWGEVIGKKEEGIKVKSVKSKKKWWQFWK